MARDILIVVFFGFISCVHGVPVYAKTPAQSLPKVHLVTHADVNVGYLDELKCMLEAVFTVEIVVHEAHEMSLRPAYQYFRRQYNASILLEDLQQQRVQNALPADGYVFYMIEPDIYDDGYRFVFALMNFDTGINVVSLSRLRGQDDGQTTDRAFRLIAKNIAKFNGHNPSGKCFMGYSNSVKELDQRAIRLCEPDLVVLQSMGLVRAELRDQTIMRGCLIIS